MSEDQTQDRNTHGVSAPGEGTGNQFTNLVKQMTRMAQSVEPTPEHDHVKTTVIVPKQVTGPTNESLQERQAEEAEVAKLPNTRWHPSDAPRDLYMQASELDAISKGKTDQVDVDLAFGHAVFNAALNSLVKDLDMDNQLVKERVRTPVLRARKMMADALKEAMAANGERKKLG